MIAYDITTLGQVFTPASIATQMLAMIRSGERFLEPSCGDGAFFLRLPEDRRVGIEFDQRHCPPGALNQDFFAYSTAEKFSCIMGNPPYVRRQDIPIETQRRLPAKFDGRANLYLFFIDKCLDHLTPGGEIIFITPRDFLKATSAIPLNKRLFEMGTITDFVDLGDTKIFEGATPNCAIWRFEKDNFSRQTVFSDAAGDKENRYFTLRQGTLSFTKQESPAHQLTIGDLFFVKVGAVSGADALFEHPEGNAEFVCSETSASGKTRRMIFDEQHPALLPNKQQLMARRIKRFHEGNWWQWGRKHFSSTQPRIYVNAKTRQASPFFTHPSTFYDGAVLALFPKADIDQVVLQQWIDALNKMDWAEQGFVCDGRFLFNQRSLLAAVLPVNFPTSGLQTK